MSQDHEGDTQMANRFVHGVELQSHNPEAAKAFYGGLFDWKFNDIPSMSYSRFATEGAEGGIMKLPGGDSTSHWVPYFLVDDVLAATAKAKSLGGKVAIEATEVPGHGWFSLVADPTGATFGLWKSGK
jgi:predicted enzyme related to lactoylglutathione lyase